MNREITLDSLNEFNERFFNTEEFKYQRYGQALMNYYGPQKELDKLDKEYNIWESDVLPTVYNLVRNNLVKD